jgi:hypothetical protein
MEPSNQIRDQLFSLASNYNNRFWMRNYILGCTILENATQTLQFEIVEGRGVATILEYNIELSKHIDNLSKVIMNTNDISSEMRPWMTSMLGHMIFLRNTVHGTDIKNLIGLQESLQLIKLGITESRIGIEEAITKSEKKLLTQKWENQLKLLH